MNAKELAHKLEKMGEEYKEKSRDKTKDVYDRSFEAGVAQGIFTANIELMENILKGDIR